LKIGEAHQTQSSYLKSANTIGAPMHPAPIVMAERTRKKNYWLTVSGQHCLLAEGDIGAPINWRTDAPAPLLLADRTQKIYINVRILSRQGEATNGSTVLAHFSCHIKRIKRGGRNSSVRFAYFQAILLLT
jgi:hypothetical protein